MYRVTSAALFCAGAIVCVSVSAQQLDGKLPIYPRGHNTSDMPAAAISAGVPLVVETSDSVDVVDGWYASNAKSCARTAQSGGVKFQCPGGSIMIYVHDAKTQVALIPSHF